jgi:hypothetical protein
LERASLTKEIKNSSSSILGRRANLVRASLREAKKEEAYIKKTIIWRGGCCPGKEKLLQMPILLQKAKKFNNSDNQTIIKAAVCGKDW